uniref:Uncharacterized protein n=1 Tax=Arundo donax TaxID=35708 RepID=A0A0A9QBD5_ARUDO
MDFHYAGFEHKSGCCISTLSGMYSRPLGQHLIVSHDTI